MQITVSGQHVELSDALNEHVWQRLEAMATRYLNGELAEAHVTFSRERRFFTCEINVHIARFELRSEGRSHDAYRAFDEAIATLGTRLVGARERRYSRRGDSPVDAAFRELLRPEEDQQ